MGMLAPRERLSKSYHGTRRVNRIDTVHKGRERPADVSCTAAKVENDRGRIADQSVEKIEQFGRVRGAIRIGSHHTDIVKLGAIRRFEAFWLGLDRLHKKTVLPTKKFYLSFDF
jgi:hypothetical protein